jgi:hypothetical protein
MAGVAGPTFIAPTEDGKVRIYEMANTKNKKAKFQIMLDNPKDGYSYTISVIKQSN